MASNSAGSRATPPPSRLADLVRFYEILAELERRVGGKRFLAKCDGRMGWPRQGVYFFFEPGEMRSDSGEDPRVVRVGTHGITDTSRATLWSRLSQHRGPQRSEGGNHRGSMFRLLVGNAILHRDKRRDDFPCWGAKRDAATAGQEHGLTGPQVRDQEREVEEAVSKRIRAMPFLWVGVDGPGGPDCERSVIERNCIALLSNVGCPKLDHASREWLGSSSDRGPVRESGLWNNNHVTEPYNPGVLDRLARCVERTCPLPVS